MVTYAFVRDIDYFQGLDLVVPHGFDKSLLKKVNCIVVCDESLFSMPLQALIKTDLSEEICGLSVSNKQQDQHYFLSDLIL